MQLVEGVSRLRLRQPTDPAPRAHWSPRDIPFSFPIPRRVRGQLNSHSPVKYYQCPSSRPRRAARSLLPFILSHPIGLHLTLNGFLFSQKNEEALRSMEGGIFSMSLKAAVSLTLLSSASALTSPGCGASPRDERPAGHHRHLRQVPDEGGLLRRGQLPVRRARQVHQAHASRER